LARHGYLTGKNWMSIFAGRFADQN